MGGPDGRDPTMDRAHLRDAQEQLELEQQKLDSLQQTREATSAFDDFLGDLSRYAEAVKETKAELGEHRFGELWEKFAEDPDSLTAQDLTGAVGAQESLEQIRDLLEASVANFVTAHEQLDDALSGIADGLEKTGKQIGRITGKIDELQTWYSRITNLPKMSGELTDEELIEAFTGYFAVLTEVLSGLIKLFPPLEAMLGWYGDVIASLEAPLKAIAAGKARTNAAIASFLADHEVPEPPSRSDLEVAIERQEAKVAALEEQVEDLQWRVDDAHQTYRQRQAAAVEDKVLRQQEAETGQRADEAASYLDEEFSQALQTGDPADAERVQRIKTESDQVEQDYRERLADHLAGNEFIDDEIVETLYDNNPWLRPMVEERESRTVDERESRDDDITSTPPATGPVAVGGAAAATGAAVSSAGNGRGPRLGLIVAGIVIAGAVAVPLVNMLTSGGEATPISEPAVGQEVQSTAPSEGDAGTVASDRVREVTLGGSVVEVHYSRTVQQGSALPIRLCSTSGETLYGTLGQDPASSDASHFNGVTGPDGCTEGELAAKEPPGTTTLWSSDGGEVAVVDDQIEITPSN